MNEVLPQEFHQSMIKKFKRKKVYSRFKENIWAAELANMELLSSDSECLLCVIDEDTKYAGVKCLIKKVKHLLMVLLK